MSVNFLLKHFSLRVLYLSLYFVILQLLFSVCVPCKLQAQEPSKSLQAWQIEGLKSAFFQPDSDVRAEMVKFCPPGFFSGLDKKVAKKSVPALIELLKDYDPDVRRSAANALGKMGPIGLHETLAILEKSYGYAEYRHTILFFAYYLSGGSENTHSQIIQIALAWLGEQTKAPLNKLKKNRDDGVVTLRAFLKVWEASAGLPNLREDLALKIGQVAKLTHWQIRDIWLLQKHFDNLEACDFNEMDTFASGNPSGNPF